MIATSVLDQLKLSPGSGPVIISAPSINGLSPKCAICGDASHGMHFGVSACRACAAFFRRSTISNRKYQCRYGGSCAIGRDVRCCCRACRMAKCLSLGMNADSVQKHRDHIGPRKRRNDSTENNEYEGDQDNQQMISRGSSTNSSTGYPSPVVASHSVPVLTSPDSQMTFLENGKSYTLLSNNIPSFFDQQPSTSTPVSMPTVYTTSILSSNSAFTPVAQQTVVSPQDPLMHLNNNDLYEKLNLPKTSPTPLLSEISKGYRKLCSLRKTTNRLRQEAGLMKLFDDNIELTEGTYNDNVATIKNDLSLVSEMISDHFIPLGRFSVDSKWLLLRNYFSSFIMGERAVNSGRMFSDKNDPRVLISSQHYISLNRMDKFFDVPSCKSTPTNVASIFEKTFTKIRKLLVNTMVELQPSDDEVAGFFGILFWSEVLEGVNEDEEALIIQTRDAIFEELYYSCRCQVSNIDELGVRFGKICNLVPLVKRLSTELSEDFSVVNILNIFDIDTFIHKLLPNSF